MLLTRSFAVLLAAAAWACGGPPRFQQPVPEDAENPIVIRFRGATAPEAIEAVSEAMSAIGISVLEEVKNADFGERGAAVQAPVGEVQGYLEAQWVDVSDFVRFTRESYPRRERIVQYQFIVAENSRGERRLILAGAYRPEPIDEALDREQLVPKDHPGYSLAMRIAERVRVALINRNATLVEEEGGEETANEENPTGGTG